MGHSKETLLKHYLRPFEGDEEVGLEEVERLLDGTVKRSKR